MEVWGGIECTINRVNDQFFDQLDYAGHYHRQNDLELICNLGIQKIRYPILWEKHQPNLAGNIEWDIAKNLDYLKSRNVSVIAGLVHHGSGPAFAPIQSDEFATGLAKYAKQVALKFPWINEYTPINEPLTTARFCGLYGFWYPHLRDDYSFLKILLNETKATIMAMEAIREINSKAKLVQTEDLGKIHSTQELKAQANFENERRWLSLDLLCGKVNKQHKLYNYIIKAGIKAGELEYFIAHAMPPDVIGFNYYITSERFLDEDLSKYPTHTHGGNSKQAYVDVEAVRSAKVTIDGAKNLLKQAWDRYQLPLAITEAHLHCGREEQLRWLNYIWEEAKQLKNEGVNLQAVTFWSLLGAYGWDKLLTQSNGNYESGVFDLSMGKPRATALAKQIKSYANAHSFEHPLISCPGWWQRPSRIIYDKQLVKTTFHMPQQCHPVLIIGANGTLGKAFATICEQRGIYYQALTRKEVDLANQNQIDLMIAKFKPWAIVNAAGFVRVDDAETESENCYISNTDGPVNLAIKCQEKGIKLLTYSSDLVFDGLKNSGYVEDDVVNPLNVYGNSKAQAEEKVLLYNPNALIIRTSAFFGPWDKYNFVHAVAETLKNHAAFNVANDVYISPTYVPDLVNASLDILIDDEKGIWHLANKGALTWHELAIEVAQRNHLNTKYLNPLPVSELGFIAKRPIYSVLTSDKGVQLQTLEKALDHYFLQVS